MARSEVNSPSAAKCRRSIPVRERMLRLERHGEGVTVSEHGAYLFVPLVEDPPTTR